MISSYWTTTKLTKFLEQFRRGEGNSVNAPGAAIQGGKDVARDRK